MLGNVLHTIHADLWQRVLESHIQKGVIARAGPNLFQRRTVMMSMVWFPEITNDDGGLVSISGFPNVEKIPYLDWQAIT